MKGTVIMKSKNIFWGLFFLLSAVFIIASQTVSFASVGIMSILATIFLAAVIISSLVQLEFFGVFVPFAFLYMIYDEPLKLKIISPWLLLASAVMISIGFSLIFRKRHKRFVYPHWSADSCSHTGENLDDNNPHAKVSLGSSSKYLHADCLQSGQFAASLGELELYFDQVQLSPGGAEVFLDCNLASIKLYIPRGWNIINKISASLGEVKENNRREKPTENAPLLTLAGNVKLGSIEIMYI